MKKKLRYIILYILLLIAVVGGSITITLLHSPEYALVKIMRDVEQSGLEGLKPHLAGELGNVAEEITEFSDNDVINSIITILNIDGGIESLESEISEIEWEVENILKSKGKANIYIRFNYKDMFSGMAEVKMIYEKREWKINKIRLLKFDEINW